MKGMNSIDKSVRWGDYFRIGEFNVIAKGVKIGSRVHIHDHIVLEENVEVGSDTKIKPFVHLQAGTKIGNGAILGSGYRSGGGKEVIGHHFEASCKSTTSPGTQIGSNVFLGPHAVILHKGFDDEHRPCTIGDNVQIGANAVIMPGITIGDGAIIGAGAIVLRDIDPDETVIGIVKPLQIIRGRYREAEPESIIVDAEEEFIPDPNPVTSEDLKALDEELVTITDDGEVIPATVENDT
jgi:acetyltransferase-like isoleucine patch superfamily enzyme